MQNQTNKKKQKEIRLVDGIKKPVKSNLFLPTEETSSLQNNGLKVVFVSVFAILISLSLSSVGNTISYYRDFERTIENLLQTNHLGFDVEVLELSSAQVDLTSGIGDLVPVMTPKENSSPIQYSVKSEYVSGDMGLCNAIQVLSTWPFPESTSLVSVVTDVSTTTGPWSLHFSVPDPSNFSNTTCTMNLVYTGFDENVPFGEGYSDTETFSITFNVAEIAPLVPASLVADTLLEETLPPVEEESLVEDPPQAETEETVAPPTPEPLPEEVVVEEEVAPPVEVVEEVPQVVEETPAAETE